MILASSLVQQRQNGLEGRTPIRRFGRDDVDEKRQKSSWWPERSGGRIQPHPHGQEPDLEMFVSINKKSQRRSTKELRHRRAFPNKSDNRYPQQTA